MEVLGIISGKLTFFAAGLALLMAVEQLIGPQRSRSNYLAASVLTADALCITGTGMAEGFTFHYPIQTLLVAQGAFPGDQETGEITPTLKLRRRYINEKYLKEIEAMYRENKSRHENLFLSVDFNGVRITGKAGKKFIEP